MKPPRRPSPIGWHTEGNVGHVVHHNTLVTWGALGDTSQPGTGDVIAVQKALLLVGLHPDFVLRTGIRLRSRQ